MLTETQSLLWSFVWLLLLVLFAWPLGFVSCLIFNIFLPFYSEIQCLEPFIVWARRGMEAPYNVAVNMSLGVPIISLESIKKSHERLPHSIMLDLANPGLEKTKGKDSEQSNLSSNSSSYLTSNSASNDNEGIERRWKDRVSPASLFLSCKSGYRPGYGSGDHKTCRFTDRSVQTDGKSVSFSSQLIQNLGHDDSSISTDHDSFRSLPSEMERRPQCDHHHQHFNSNHTPVFTSDHLVFSQRNNSKSRQKYRPGAIVGRDHRRFRSPVVTWTESSDSSQSSTCYSSAISQDDVTGRQNFRKLDERLTQLKRCKNHVTMKKKVYTVYER